MGPLGTDRPSAQDEFVTIAKVIKPQGRHGEVAAVLFTDFPERFESRKRLFALDKGSVYVSDLIGCMVFDGDREIGTVKDVQFGAGEAPLVVVKGTTKEYLV